jgi:hypothetical protein
LQHRLLLLLAVMLTKAPGCTLYTCSCWLTYVCVCVYDGNDAVQALCCSMPQLLQLSGLSAFKCALSASPVPPWHVASNACLLMSSQLQSCCFW